MSAGFIDLFPKWEGEPIAMRTPSTAVWATYISMCGIGLLLQYLLYPELLRKAEQHRIKSESKSIRNSDVHRASTPIQAMFSLLYIASMVMLNVNPLLWGFKHGVAFTLMLHQFMLGLDLLVSDAHAVTLMNMKRNGYSTKWTIFFFAVRDAVNRYISRHGGRHQLHKHRPSI